MKRIFPILLSIAFLVSCGRNVPVPPDVAAPAASATINTQVPPTVTPGNIPTDAPPTSTDIPLPPTATPVPPEAARWYWSLEEGTDRILAVDQSGETREIGLLPSAEKTNYAAFPVDAERALLITDDSTRIRVYLLTLGGMQPVQLPDYMTYNPYLSGTSIAVPAVYGDYAVFSYADQQSSESSSGSMAERGPLMLVDLKSLTSRMVDDEVNRGNFSSAWDSRFWAYRSEDGRYLRYLDGDRQEMNLRELDLSTGEARTVHTTTGHVTSQIATSFHGDLWLFYKDSMILDLDGNRTGFADETLKFRSTKGEQILVLPAECADQCEIKVVSPFSDQAEMAYQLPWAGRTYINPLLYQLAPDQSLVFVGIPLKYLSSAPAIASEYPNLNEADGPVFRLTPDGGARLVGSYASGFAMDTIPVSTDGRYMLLNSLDQPSFLLYDVFEDRTVAEMPVYPGLDYFWANAAFLENGIIVHFTAKTADRTYRDFFLSYSFLTGKYFHWEDVSGTFAGCIDILPDESLACWTYRSDTGAAKLLRYVPETQETTTLLENAWSLQMFR